MPNPTVPNEISDYRLAEIALEDIDFGERLREDLGNLTAFANEISENGVITPVAVCDKEHLDEEELSKRDNLDPSKPYLLVAGERRSRASIKAGLNTIPAKIYTRAVSTWEARLLEHAENLHRKEMTPYEDAKAKREIHQLYIERFGEYDQYTNPDGHKQSDTANILDASEGGISQDLEIAEWGETDEDVRSASTKREAKALIRQKKKKLAREEKARRLKERHKEDMKNGKDGEPANIKIEGADGAKNYDSTITQRFINTDYFDGMAELPNRSIDVLELDPDWGIDFIKKRASKNALEKKTPYRSIPPEAYEETIREILETAWPKMKDHSWLLLWYSIEKWHRETWEIATDVGFSVCPMPAIWLKKTGNTATPAYRLGDCAGYFYYARKGSPRIQNMGRDNVFEFRSLKRSEKLHAAEKPIELYEEIFQTFSTKGSVVVSGFAGSGNAILAADNLNMNSLGFDIEKENKENFSLKVDNLLPGPFKSYEENFAPF